MIPVWFNDMGDKYTVTHLSIDDRCHWEQIPVMGWGLNS